MCRFGHRLLMKTTFTFLGVILLGILNPLRAEVVLQPNDMVAFCGDSITEQKIYTVFLEDYFLMMKKLKHIWLIVFVFHFLFVIVTS